MLNWIAEIEEPSFHHREEALVNFRMREVTVNERLIEMSPACQLFAALDIINGEAGVMTYPTPTKQAKMLVMEKVAPHYKEIKETIIEGKVEEINVFKLKQESADIIENLLHKSGYMAICDLYRNKRTTLDRPKRIKYYRINKEQIQLLYTRETADVFAFFDATFFVQEQSILLQPTGWQLNDELKCSYTIRAFGRLAGELVLWVNEITNEVIGLEVYRSKNFLPLLSKIS